MNEYAVSFALSLFFVSSVLSLPLSLFLSVSLSVSLGDEEDQQGVHEVFRVEAETQPRLQALALP